MTWKLPTYLYRMQFYTFISDNLLTKNPCTKLGHDWKWVWQRSWFLSHVYNANFPFLVPPNLEKTFQTFPFSLTVSALFNFPFNTRWTCPERLCRNFIFGSLYQHLRTQVCSPWSEHEGIPQVEHLVKIFFSLNDSVHMCHLQYILILGLTLNFLLSCRVNCLWFPLTWGNFLDCSNIAS